MAATILRFERPPQPSTQRVCGSCRFYQKDKWAPMLSACHAVGGCYASDVWPRCQGKLWQENLPWIRRLMRLVWS